MRPNAPVELKWANQPSPDGVSTQPPWCGPWIAVVPGSSTVRHS